MNDELWEKAAEATRRLAETDPEAAQRLLQGLIERLITIQQETSRQIMEVFRHGL